MPVRFLNSVVLKWPDRERVLLAARKWSAELRRDHPEVEGVFCVGSYARGDWGVGSDIDLVVLSSDSDTSLSDRHGRYYPRDLPVPADLWIYTPSEWNSISINSPFLWKRLSNELLDLLEDGSP